MCQKASGGPFASLADIRHEDFRWTRGKPSAFQSSSIAERDFCPQCGTPLSYRRIGGPNIEIMTGAFDRPNMVSPVMQFGTESQLDWTTAISAMPGKTTVENYGEDKVDQIVNHQHPDHD